MLKSFAAENELKQDDDTQLSDTSFERVLRCSSVVSEIRDYFILIGAQDFTDCPKHHRNACYENLIVVARNWTLVDSSFINSSRSQIHFFTYTINEQLCGLRAKRLKIGKDKKYTAVHYTDNVLVLVQRVIFTGFA